MSFSSSSTYTRLFALRGVASGIRVLYHVLSDNAILIDGDDITTKHALQAIKTLQPFGEPLYNIVIYQILRSSKYCFKVLMSCATYFRTTSPTSNMAPEPTVPSEHLAEIKDDDSDTTVEENWAAIGAEQLRVSHLSETRLFSPTNIHLHRRETHHTAAQWVFLLCSL